MEENLDDTSFDEASSTSEEEFNPEDAVDLQDRILNGEVDDLSNTKFASWSERVQNIFLKTLKDEESRRERISKNNRSREERKLRKIKEKLEAGIELEPMEQSFFDASGHKVTSIEPAQVAIDASEILDGVVKGDFTIQEVHAAREGVKEAEAKDPVENSPLQFLDNVLEDSLQRTKEALKTKEPGQFFESTAPESNDVIPPEQMKHAIDHASTAIQLALGNPISTNEAKEACDSFILASSMNEAELKMQKRQEIAKARVGEINKMAAAAAVAASSAAVAAGNPPLVLAPGAVVPGFNVTNLNLDISFLPSQDPDIYKPLEILSYIGMTSIPL